MSQLQTTTETLGKDRVRVIVEVPEGALEPAKAEVYRRWSKEMKIPGFRKGKIPRQLIDARVGVDAIREEALRDALPDLYREALQAEELEPIAPPDIEVTKFEANEPIIFEAVVDTRPEVIVPELSSIKIEAAPSEVTDEELDEQLHKLADRFAELEPVGREARRGDYVLIDMNGSRAGAPVEGASAPDYLYEVGSEQGPPSLDDQLQGSRPGAILKFADEVHIHDGDEHEHDHDHSSTDMIDFTILVKEVKAKKLPEIDDEFAKTVGEFGTLDELKDDVRPRLAEAKINMVEQQLRGKTVEALVDASDLEAPEKLVDGELEHRLEQIESDLTQAGMTLAQYAERINSTELEIRSDMRAQAARSVKAELLLEEIARQNGIDVTQEDIGLEIAYAAARSNQDPKLVAEQVVQGGGLSSLAADILRRKAVEHVLENIEVANRPVRPEPPVTPETPEETDEVLDQQEA
ncbi:MAG: trigger factor [Actinobacteria bacterium]|nr:trigger factor [Actinomycetota bacterium]